MCGQGTESLIELNQAATMQHQRSLFIGAGAKPWCMRRDFRAHLPSLLPPRRCPGGSKTLHLAISSWSSTRKRPGDHETRARDASQNTPIH